MAVLHVDTKRYWFVGFTRDYELRKRVVEGQTHLFLVVSILDFQVILYCRRNSEGIVGK